MWDRIFILQISFKDYVLIMKKHTHFNVYLTNTKNDGHWKKLEKTNSDRSQFSNKSNIFFSSLKNVESWKI